MLPLGMFHLFFSIFNHFLQQFHDRSDRLIAHFHKKAYIPFHS